MEDIQNTLDIHLSHMINHIGDIYRVAGVLSSHIVTFYETYCKSTVFEPTCAYARWALMHRFAFVRLSVTGQKFTEQ